MKVENVSYQEPTIQRTLLGKKPANQLNDSPQVGRDFVSIGEALPTGETQSVWGDVPLKNPDGTPQMRTVTADLDVTPRSPLKYGAIAAGVGAAVGGLAGLAFSGGMAALVGGLTGAGLAGGVAALAVRGDRVKLVWNSHEIVDQKYLGYHEYVGEGEKDGRRGYFHRYVPEVQSTILGIYKTPQAVHYKEEAKS